MTSELEALRDQIDELDRSILEAIKKRSDVASEIGRIKAANNLPVRNFDREKVCIENARRVASELGLPLQIAEEVELNLIRASLTSQEQDRVRLNSSKETQKAAIIGGAGKMGNWFAHFLSSQGYAIDVLDPNARESEFSVIRHLEDTLAHDVIVVAAPLHESNSILLKLAKLRPRALLFDIASLKGPLKEGLMAVATSEMNVTSMHPMFGPSTQLLSGRHVILVDLGNKKANVEASALFSPTMATIVEMDAEDHDRNMAFLLGLSHAVNIAFSSVLSQSGESAPRLWELSSTTFDAQASIASRVAMENPKLYFEIQAANPFADLSLELLEAATSELRHIVKNKDEARFFEMMRAGFNYFKEHKKKD